MFGATESRSTRRREAPAGAKSYTVNGVLRESPTWRLRSKSTSHDHELFRMGLREDGNGDFAVSNSRVPPGLANAMRAATARSKSRIKRVPTKWEESEEMDIYSASDDEGMDKDSEEGEGVDDPTVYDYEEIRVYLDVQREITYLDLEAELEGGYVYVDEEGVKVETVYRSVEAETIDVDMVDEKNPAASGDVDDDRIEVDSRVENEGPERPVTNTVHPVTAAPVVRRRRKWTDPEIHYVGALLDAGYKTPSIMDLFHERFPDAGKVTPNSIQYIRERIMHQVDTHLKPIRTLSEELGLDTGKWRNLNKAEELADFDFDSFLRGDSPNMVVGKDVLQDFDFDSFLHQ